MKNLFIRKLKRPKYHYQIVYHCANRHDKVGEWLNDTVIRTSMTTPNFDGFATIQQAYSTAHQILVESGYGIKMCKINIFLIRKVR